MVRLCRELRRRIPGIRFYVNEQLEEDPPRVQILAVNEETNKATQMWFDPEELWSSDEPAFHVEQVVRLRREGLAEGAVPEPSVEIAHTGPIALLGRGYITNYNYRPARGFQTVYGSLGASCPPPSEIELTMRFPDVREFEALRGAFQRGNLLSIEMRVDE